MALARALVIELQKMPLWAKNILIVSAASIILGLFAQVAIPLPFTPVPLITQDALVLLMAALLGPKRAVASVAAFLAQGAMGFPVFARGGSGLLYMAGPTGGYLVGYLLAAFVVASLIELFKTRSIWNTLYAMVAGQIAIYACGVAWLSTFVGFSQAILLGVVPFLLGSALKIGFGLKLLHWIGWERNEMLKFLAGLMLIGAAFAAAFYAGKKESERLAHSVVPPFSPSSYPSVNRPFVIVITAFNNGAYVEKTLSSIFSQKYDSYRLVYIDDASDDGSFALARDLMAGRKNAILLRNEQRIGFAASLARAVEGSQDGEIVVVVGDSDRLAHEWVLQRLNQYYANPDLWLAASQAREYPYYGVLSTSELRTFYASLFKQMAAPDEDYWAPMLEMGQGHFCAIEEVHYLANQE